MRVNLAILDKPENFGYESGPAFLGPVDAITGQLSRQCHVLGGVRVVQVEVPNSGERGRIPVWPHGAARKKADVGSRRTQPLAGGTMGLGTGSAVVLRTEQRSVGAEFRLGREHR